MATPKPRSLAPAAYGQVLRDALETELSPEITEAVIFNALRLAGADEVPADPAGFVFFVLGSLDAAVERRAGRHVAEAILAELEPLLASARENAQASSTVSGFAPKSEPSFPAVADSPLTESGVHPRLGPDEAPLSGPPSSPPVSHAQPALSEPSGAPAPIAQKTFLVASADGRLRDALRRTLQRDGHRVVAAHDGHVGLALCVRYEPHVVICDLDMPRVTGKELVSSIKLALGRCAPRVIMLTPEPMDRLPDVLHQLPRPVHPDVLKRAIEAALS